MIKPVAARLRSLLEQDPTRSRCSLLITGHSAGGAIAALIYSHMLSTNPETESELSRLTGFFRRIHCVTFGAPPVSLLPLQKPPKKEFKKSLFLSFVNEGDPVARISLPYFKALVELYAAPAPKIASAKPSSVSTNTKVPESILKGGKAASSSMLSVNKIRPSAPKHSNSASYGTLPTWPVPSGGLSNAGKIVLLRAVPRSTAADSKEKGNYGVNEVIQARLVTDEQLRGAVFGDLLEHGMERYSKRIEILATNAVMVQR
jgi:hypothetical protein